MFETTITRIKFLVNVLLGFLSLLYFSANAQEIDTSSAGIQEMVKYFVKRDSVEKAMKYERGSVVLKDGLSTIKVPAGFKFLGAEQSKYVLTTLWGNPPSEVLGMLFPEYCTPYTDSAAYAIEITYSEEGHIKDDDAKDIDYSELLETMKSETEEANKERIKEGYASVELIGWAQSPFYDEKSKKLHWAKELKFNGDSLNTLNYNIRVLGRKGYLNLNVIGSMDVLPLVKENINPILSSVEFNSGNKYSDFNPGIDEVAALGIGGLIAGKVLAKVGFFALLVKFWKVILIGGIAAVAGIKQFFFGKKNEYTKEA